MATTVTVTSRYINRGAAPLGGGAISIEGTEAGVSAHSQLSQLAYAVAGHVGFAPIDNPTFTTKVTTPALKVTTGAAAGNILVSDASGDLTYLAAGALTEMLVGGGAANPVWTTATGTGAPVRAGSPTFTTKITTPLIYGTDVANGDISIEGTIHATKTTSKVLIQPTGGTVGIGFVSPLSTLCIDGGLHVGGESDAGDNNLFIDGTAQEPNFTMGFQGTNWRIEADGDAEFENMFIRGGLTVSELIINQLHYQNGGLIIGAGAGKIATIEDDTQGSEIVTFQDPEGDELIPFTPGAIVKMQKVDIDRTTVVRVLVREVLDTENSSGGGFTVEFTETVGWVAADDDVGVFEVGDEVCAIGHTSDTNLDSCIYLSATDSGNPFLRVLDGVDTYAKFTTAGASLKLQLGNLESVAGYDIVPVDPGYGLYCDNVYLTGKIIATSGEIGGWIISDNTIQDPLGEAGMTVEDSSEGAIRFWAGADSRGPAFADFQVAADGSLTAVGVLELGTQTVSVEGAMLNLAIAGPDIWENSYDGVGTTYINRIGYQGGTTQFRNTEISDGKGNSMATFIGASDLVSFASSIIFTTGALMHSGGDSFSYMIEKQAAATLRHSHDAEANTTNSTWTLAKTITFNHGLKGEARFVFELKFVDNAGDGATAYGRIYRNGVALGTEQSTTDTVYASKSEDITYNWLADDECQLWIKTDDGTEFDAAWVQNFTIRYDNNQTVAVKSTNS